jgi:flagellar biosynthesis protein FliQ
MNDSIVIEIMQQTLYTVTLLSAPPLITQVVIGLMSQILQTVTQLKDQSLSFIPKMGVTAIVLVAMLPWYITTVKSYFNLIFNYMEIATQ